MSCCENQPAGSPYTAMNAPFTEMATEGVYQQILKHLTGKGLIAILLKIILLTGRDDWQNVW